MAYVNEKSKNKFTSINSMAFPSFFYDYLQKNIFKNFDLETGEVDLSRHRSSHGVAHFSKYTKEKALQAILVLDQIFFFIN